METCDLLRANSLALAPRAARPWMKSIVSLAHVQVSDVRINLRRRNVRVAQERLHRTRVRTVLHQMRAKTVTQSVRRNIRYACIGSVSLDDRPGILAGHLSPAMHEQLRLCLIAHLFSDGQISQ